VLEVQRLRADHAAAVLAFELANRTYFAASISDRGDDFFDQFTERHSALLAEQEAGLGAFYVLVAEDGSVLGRFNLVFAGDGTAELGYRVAQHIAGRGVATATVRELCQLAADRHALRTLKAATSRENAASQKVLAKAGFVPAGPADPAHLGGKPGRDVPTDLFAARITAREVEVLERLASARSTKDIAAELFLSPKTVERHISNLAVKLGVDGRAALVAFAAARAARLNR
jgi:[ribosomal protein S5]-alanine N-acetyltransferase